MYNKTTTKRRRRRRRRNNEGYICFFLSLSLSPSQQHIIFLNFFFFLILVHFRIASNCCSNVGGDSTAAAATAIAKQASSQPATPKGCAYQRLRITTAPCSTCFSLSLSLRSPRFDYADDIFPVFVFCLSFRFVSHCISSLSPFPLCVNIFFTLSSLRIVNGC